MSCGATNHGPPPRTDPPIRLGAAGPEVFPIALGCTGMSGMYGPADEERSIATIHAAIERGQAHNERVVAALQSFARERGLSRAQLAIAWVLAKQPSFVPVLGARTPAQLDDALAALQHPLSRADLEQLEALAPPDAIEGTRYDPGQMAHLDSER